MEQRTESWPMPHMSRLESGGLQPGQSVIIQGVVQGERFDINLAADNTLNRDIPLHMSVRLNEGKFVLNTLRNGEWGKEERHSCPYKKGNNFDIRIRAHDNKFEIFANQKEIGTYEYRQPLSSIQYLAVSGDATLHGINWGGKYYSVPYHGQFENGFRPGMKLYISGMLEEKGKGFSINILNNKREIIFHFNPRFNEKAIVRNSELGGVWGKEEREGKFTLEKNKTFDIIIANEGHAYQAYVNGQHFCAFAHRADAGSGTSFTVEGDVELQGVYMK